MKTTNFWMNYRHNVISMTTTRRSIVKGVAVAAFAATLTACGPVEIAGLAAGAAALKNAGEQFHNLLLQADEVTRNRTADLDARIGQRMKELDQLIKGNVAGIEDAAHGALDKTFHELNEQLFQASLLVQQADVDLNRDITVAMLNFARVISGIPFVGTKPFLAMVYPTTLIPGRALDYKITVYGYFDHALGLPTLRVKDATGAPVGPAFEATIGTANDVYFLLPRALVGGSQGKRVTAEITYPTAHRYVLPNARETRTISLFVMPETVLTYEVVSAKALPDFVYDEGQAVYPYNCTADNGAEENCEFSKTLEDVVAERVGPTAFQTTYDRDRSLIATTQLRNVGGNNPTGDNRVTVVAGSGGQVRVVNHAHSKPDVWFSGPKGANAYAEIVVTYRLARKRSTEEWQFANAGSRTGSVRWGQSAMLLPQATSERPEMELSSLRMEVTDYSFDPPMHRSIQLRENYSSKYGGVETNPTRIAVNARSLPISN